MALRYEHWKIVFEEQRAHGFDVWQEPFDDAAVAEALRPARRSVRAGGHESIDYSDWRIERVFLLVPAQAYVGQFLATFKEFPPRQKAGSFTLDAGDAEAEAGEPARANRRAQHALSQGH